ncbi:adenylyl cyclase-associated protein 1-like [Euwallacea fornicatus]|uniref:adenylyl cyclase-associated protein 1-like n=1 Tax=Euwallacea fornicatus TaxID=995702 RepID=UPI00338FB9AE
MDVAKKSPVLSGRLKARAAFSVNPIRTIEPKAKAPPALQSNVVSVDGMWRIENYVANHSVLIDKADMKSIVYIFKCIESTITVGGKVTAIIIDNCKKCVIVMDTVIGFVEVLNSQTIKTHIQKQGIVSNITVDNTDGCCMELSPLSLGVQVITSRATDMVVVFPRGNGEFARKLIPDQFRTVISQDMLLVTTYCPK